MTILDTLKHSAAITGTVTGNGAAAPN